jgi:hypothetical protein
MSLNRFGTDASKVDLLTRAESSGVCWRVPELDRDFPIANYGEW